MKDPSWLPFWNWAPSNQSPGKGNGGGYSGGKGLSKKDISTVVWNTMSRFDRPRGGKGGGKPNGGKSPGGRPHGGVWDRPYQTFQKQNDKGGKKGGKGKGKGKK